MRIVAYALLLLSLLIVLTTACTHDPYIPVVDDDNKLACDTLGVTLSDSVRPILMTYCYACHNTLGAPASGGGYNLESYTSLQSIALSGRLIGAITHDSANYVPMPQGGAMLPECDIAKIQTWVNAGAPNN